MLPRRPKTIYESAEAEGGYPEVMDAAVFGGGLHVTVADAERAITGVRRALEGAGIGVMVLERIEPSMEDVFVSLIEEEERKAA